MSEPQTFDASAAEIRRMQTDLPAFAEALAARLQGAFPTEVTIERQRLGLFSGKSRVSKIILTTPDYAYTLACDVKRLTASRCRTVRGVRLSGEDMSLPEWMRALDAELVTLAEATGAAHATLHDFLIG